MNSLYDIKLKDKEVALSAEELLTMFNRNISKNAELLDYLGQNNLFGIIGKARNEGVHSRFVAELLAGSFFNGDSRESTLFHFLDMLLYRAGKENKADEVNEHLRKAILTRSGLFETKTSVCELPVKEYQKRYGGNQKKTAEKDDRIDIYLRYRLLNPIAGRDTLEIFMENKVNSAEFDSQTVRYYDSCNNGGFKRPFQLFVYLTPQPVRDMDHYAGLDRKLKPDCPHYIHICYQDILDYVIEPLASGCGLDANQEAILREYVSCLELPAMPDADTPVPVKGLSIMAISAKEKELVRSFMEDAINRRLVDKTIEVKLGEPLYSVVTYGTLFNSQEAIEGALLQLINTCGKPLDVLKAVADCKVIGPQGGSDPFLVYSPKHWRNQEGWYCKYLPFDSLYVYSGKVFVSVSAAVAAAIKDYKEKQKKTNEELVQLFSGIYSAKGSGVPLVSVKKQKGTRDTDVEGLFVRNKVAEDRLPGINAILGKALSINPIDNTSYMALMQLNTQVALDTPVTENALPKEIDDLTESVCRYAQVGNTDFFFRKDIKGDAILKLNDATFISDHQMIDKCTDVSLLLEFFKSRRNLILSVYKILLEAETNNNAYKEKLAIYRKLLQS